MFSIIFFDPAYFNGRYLGLRLLRFNLVLLGKTVDRKRDKTKNRSSRPKSNPADFRAVITNPDMSVSRTLGLGVKTIMIDAGHGGAHSGTKGKMGTVDKETALDIAKQLRARLEKSGRFNIVMTRNQDITISLKQESRTS